MAGWRLANRLLFAHPSMQESCQSANGLGGIRVLEAARILGGIRDHAAS